MAYQKIEAGILPSRFPCVFKGLSVMTLLYARIRHDDVFLQEHF